MSGYMMAIGSCFSCARTFAFNPLTVPSTSPDIHPTREPICQICMQRINKLRQARGMPAFPIASDAYEAVEA